MDEEEESQAPSSFVLTRVRPWLISFRDPKVDRAKPAKELKILALSSLALFASFARYC